MSIDFTLEGGVRVWRAHGIAHIEFHHPQSNSLPSRVLAKLAQAITDEGAHPESHVIVLRSAGDRVFCGGASFDELATIRTEEEGLHFFGGFAGVINALRKCPKLTIGRIQGKAVGGGVGLASAVDYCLATQHASIKLSELAVGIGPFVVGPAVARKIGLSAMSQLAIDAAEFRTAEWAMNHGLYAEVHPDIDSLDAGVQKHASWLSQQSATAQAELKKVFWEGCENWDSLLAERAAISGALVRSPESQAAIQRIHQSLSAKKG
ncbi:MAG: enoyl-CoA hydratase/isomerase family protein [Schleiferiaceae bacterium]|nr:enoyl-CoA hydratase/isomerase family protein [Schleiferiaceae bacterium]